MSSCGQWSTTFLHTYMSISSLYGPIAPFHRAEGQHSVFGVRPLAFFSLLLGLHDLHFRVGSAVDASCNRTTTVSCLKQLDCLG